MISNGRKDAEAICQSIMRTLKCNRAVAVGICANICYESGFRSAVEENVDGYSQAYLDRVGIQYDGKWLIGGYGLFQHTNSRRIALYDWCKENGFPVEDMESQVAFMYHELQHFYKWFLNENCQLPDNSDTAYQCAYDFAKFYEVPADTENQAQMRGQTAIQMYNNGWDV